jgi:hypothetical protein
MNTNFLTQANVGNISTNKIAEARKAINERWENLGFTKGFNGYLKDNMSILFENQAAQLLKEATDSSNSGSFETVVFPLVRRVFSRLLANDIVSVQAMNMPIGKLFFILPVTSRRSWEKDANGNWEGSHYGLMGYEREDRNNNGEPVNRYYLPDEVVNLDASGKTPEVVKYMKKSLYDLFYNDGLFDHSKGKIHIHTATSGDVKPAEFYFTGDMLTEGSELLNGETAKVTIPVNSIDDTVRNVILEVGGFASYKAGKLIGPDGNEMDTEAFLASLRVVANKEIASAKIGEGKEAIDTASFKEGEKVHYRCVTQRYGKGLVEYGNPCDAEGKIYIEIDLAKPTKKVHQTMDGFVGVDPKAITVDTVADMFTVAWAQYDSLELETEIGEVSFKLSDVTVSVEERKLRATWSPEMAQDVAAFHNIDAEAELTAILSEQIAAEIDREILRDLRHGAPWQLRWDYNGWRRQMAFSTNYTQKDWNQTFMTLINQISAQIHKATLRGGANFVVVSTEISAMLNDLEYFHVTDANAEAVNYSLGIEKVGSLQGRYTVYVDPYSPSESCILGHKGDSLLDTGYIYAPYVPMQLTPTIYNAENFAPVKGIITRYAKKMVNNRYYGAIVCSGLQTWNIMELR